MALVASGQYPAVRAALDVTLDAEALPDAVIALDLYAGTADRWVLAQDPTAEARTGDALKHVTAAAVLYCASLLAPALPQLTGETHGAHQYSRKAVDASALADQLVARAVDELTAVLQPDDVRPVRPTMFALASGRRGF